MIQVAAILQLLVPDREVAIGLQFADQFRMRCLERPRFGEMHDRLVGQIGFTRLPA
jgi:hypothetical protein